MAILVTIGIRRPIHRFAIGGDEELCRHFLLGALAAGVFGESACLRESRSVLSSSDIGPPWQESA
jgi:hypothetical protein